jgi:NAD kinase
MVHSLLYSLIVVFVCVLLLAKCKHGKCELPAPKVLSFAAGSLGFLTPYPLDSWVLASVLAWLTMLSFLAYAVSEFI